jgi:putative cardiolipin synthase
MSSKSYAFCPDAGDNRVWLWLFVALAANLICGCSGLPTRPAEYDSVPTVNLHGTVLEAELGSAVAEHFGLTGVHPIEHGLDAFATRMALVKAAERTLDVQYYIWHPDETGRFLANELIQAANRGVRVRLLLDDIGTSADDENLLALDNHTNIEVRLFNPVTGRKFRGLSTLFDFGRVNRRMHNKSLTVDAQVTLVGGRNIGNEYFGFGPGVEFADFDVVAIGSIVKSAADAFELFWNSPSSMPMALVNKTKISAEETAQKRATLAAQCEELKNLPYAEAARNSRLITDLRERDLKWFWGRAQLVYDLPDKVTTSPGERVTHLMPQLRPVVDRTERELLIISPYFVPGSEGVKFFKSLRQRGVRVVIITNSLEANDVAIVHAGYRRYRRALLRAGVELYEFKAAAAMGDKTAEKKSLRGSRVGSSSVSLHAKTFVFDQRNIFVGSLNLDPRSTSLNTEIGAVIDLPELAKHVAERIEQHGLQNCYRLELVRGTGANTNSTWINWVSEENGTTKRYKKEPNASFGRRFLVGFMSWLPIESQL